MKTVTPEELLGPLNDIEEKYAPKALYVAGQMDAIASGPRVAIVGSRDASPEGLRQATALARLLAHRGATVVSGLARGIDTAAHLGAIEAGGRTIAVLGTPLDAYATKPNRLLQDLIMREHLAISQFESGSVVRPSNFPTRNRTMALVCQASVIIEAGEGSGTLSQGWEALRLGRPLFLGEQVIRNDSLEWPSKMLSYGAQVLPDLIDEVLEMLPNPAEQSLAVAF